MYFLLTQFMQTVVGTFKAELEAALAYNKYLQMTNDPDYLSKMNFPQGLNKDTIQQMLFEEQIVIKFYSLTGVEERMVIGGKIPKIIVPEKNEDRNSTSSSALIASADSTEKLVNISPATLTPMNAMRGWTQQFVGVSNSNATFDWLDPRRCIFCGEGSCGAVVGNLVGRMVFLSDGQSCHINCLRWSAEVVEREGVLCHVNSAIARCVFVFWIFCLNRYHISFFSSLISGE